VITALAGGVGAARLLRGMVEVVAPGEITAVVNTADDTVLHGLHVSPDLDTVVYTLAGAINPDTGWGLAGETWRVMESLAALGGLTWFRLGDRDLATHCYRTQRLAEGATLGTVTAELARTFGVGVRIVPVTDDPLRTRLRLVDGPEVGFQEYFVRFRHEVAVAAVRFEGAETALPGPGVLEAIAAADTIVICPSNPVISIGPILAVPGVRELLVDRRDRVVAVSPIVGGAPVKGPADRLMGPLGIEVSCVGVADAYTEFCSALVIDAVDAELALEVEARGVHAVVTDTMMRSPAIAAALAAKTLAAVA